MAPGRLAIEQEVYHSQGVLSVEHLVSAFNCHCHMIRTHYETICPPHPYICQSYNHCVGLQMDQQCPGLALSARPGWLGLSLVRGHSPRVCGLRLPSRSSYPSRFKLIAFHFGVAWVVMLHALSLPRRILSWAAPAEFTFPRHGLRLASGQACEVAIGRLAA